MNASPLNVPGTLGMCPLCGAGEMAFLFESAGFHFYRCPSCTYVKRAEPASATVHKYHDEAYAVQYGDDAEQRIKKRGVLGLCSRFAPQRGRLLDVGCSLGYMLEEAEKTGWEAHGVELSEDAVAKARARGVKNIMVKDLADLDYPEGYFDLIVMTHVLEHLDDPFGYLGKMARWLKKGGIMYVSVPNFSSHSAKRDGKDWTTLVPGEHISQFTVRALKTAVEKYSGCAVREVSGDHRFGEEPSGVAAKVKYFLVYLKDRLLIGRGLYIIAQKP